MIPDALQEKQVPLNKVSPFFKGAAVFISYIFHPIFIPIYVIAFLLYWHPSYFAGFSEQQKSQVLFITLLNLVLFPLLSILLLKAVGFIDSVFLRTQKDRIIPYMACGIFFFWAYTVFKQQEMYPAIMPSFIMGIFLASSGALLANIYFKVSIHAIGMGGLVGLFLVIFREQSMLMTWPLGAAILFTGMVCSARLLISDHSPRDIYAGFFIGLLSQVVAAFFLL